MNSQTDGILATAAAALERNEVKQPGNFERKWNSATDKYSDATGKPFSEAVNAAISSGVGNLIQSQLSGWKTASSTLAAALDELQKIHPFISVAVLPFKAALHLELKRRENDAKVIALHFMMKEMMETLLILKDISVGDDANLSAYLTKTSEILGRDIIDYASAADAYYSRKLFSRILRSQNYESDLAACGDRFEKNKQELQLRLTVRTNLKLNEVTNSLSVMMLFNLVRSTEERELVELIDKEGGASKVMKDPTLLEKIIKESEKNRKDRGAHQNDDDDKRLVSLIRAEIRDDLQKLIKSNEITFNLKFEAQKKELIDSLGKSVERMGDRVIEAVTSGPYERLKDPHLFEIWKEMHSRWGGNAKARDLVFALRDFYYTRNQSALGPTRQMLPTISARIDSVGASHISGVATNLNPPVTTTDPWALQYITFLCIQPLIEAFDDDASGYVTINEANAFSAGRPKDWSMLHWVAYWAIGFQTTLKYYHKKIWTLLQQMHTAAEQTLPANRVFIDWFLSADPFRRLDSIISGFQEQTYYHGACNWTDWSKFLPYVEDEEKRLKGQLEELKYSIDASDSLLLITGQGRLERFIFPLIYLLLKRQYLIIDYCRSSVIHPGILWNSLRSVDVIMYAVNARVDDLRAVFKHKNLDEAAMMRKAVYGLFSSWRSDSWHYKLYKFTPIELTSKLTETDMTSTDFISLEPILHDYTSSDAVEESPEGMDTFNQDTVDFLMQTECRDGWLPYIALSYITPDGFSMARSMLHAEEQDVQYYCSLAWFKARRQMVHNASCEICDGDVIGSRFLCLDCLLEYDDNSTDFCIQHFREYFIRKAPKCEVVHTRHHLLLQLRRCLASRRLFSVANSSRAAFEKVEARLGDPSGHRQCGNCEQSVSLPCWFCIDCDDEFFLCFECNAHDNMTEPWMVDKHLRPEEGHTYIHKLVLCPEPKPDEPKALSVEERLEATEKHMETMEKHMEEMEKHMEATKMNMEKHVQAMEKRMEETGKHIEEAKKHMEASQHSLQELLELQKENNMALQKGIRGMST
ncbi:uncharacterized protein ARMOST_21867 [Armillaria ostoyae]|uniref:ZZ-type domain-containing protein n=1 Tax=Armillaria ostoyae TaxID=47428 RepID=A0A284SBA5_ARMOS|nr:uncharacterized protein ARMOST_21867 [Armillaria ostoyae]